MFRAALWIIVLLMARLPAAAQPGLVAPAPPYYAIEPTNPLTPTARNPVQQQILENYRTQLRQTQRDLLLRNPAGVGAQQRDVNRQLNALGAGTIPLAPAPGTPAPRFNPAPFAGAGALPAPPFNAAPPPSAGALQ